MNPFFYTTESVPPDAGFSLYSLPHLIHLLAVFLTIWLVRRLFIKGDKKRKRHIFITVAILLLLDEGVKVVFLVSTGQYWAGYLPLHLCSIDIFVTAFASLFPDNKYLKEYLFAISLPAALMAELFPSWASLPPYALMTLHSVSVHGLLMLYPILLLSDGFRPNARNLWPSILFLLVYMIPLYFFNKHFGTNFMFLNGGGEGNPLSLLSSVFGNYYLLFFPLIAALLWRCMYFAVRLIEKKKPERG